MNEAEKTLTVLAARQRQVFTREDLTADPDYVVATLHSSICAA